MLKIGNKNKTCRSWLHIVYDLNNTINSVASLPTCIIAMLAAVFSMMLCTTTAIASDYTCFKLEPSGYSIIFPKPNKTQLEVIKQLEGKDISLGEYIEKVYPTIMKDVPKHAKKKLYLTRIIWPKHEPIEIVKNFTSTRSQLARSDVVETKAMEIILMWHQSALEENPERPKLKHTSWSYVIYPWQYKLPFMAVESYL